VRHPYFAVEKPIVFGHRGASGEAPENTLVAFERALAQGAAILETDVHVTRDGEVVVSHDPDVSRNTGAKGRIAELTCAELARLDAGYRFSPDGGATHPWRGCGIRIPSLREVFEALPAARLNIEVKDGDPRLVAGVVRLVAEHARAERTLLAAAEDDTLAAVRAELERQGVRPALGASIGDVLGYVRAALGQGEPPREPMALQIPPSFAGKPLVTPRLVAFAHAHDVQVHVWTINDEAEMERLLALGVDGVMSDFPGRLRAVVDRERVRGGVARAR
jgi:glycerophosphoryl diester phosphodiesterase